MKTYKTPGVYVEEISTLAPSVAEVETAIPAFIGYTEKGDKNVPVRITSMVDYQLNFGSAEPEKSLTIKVLKDIVTAGIANENKSRSVMFYAMQLYFANGGGPCYIVSAGNYQDSASPKKEAYKAALDIVETLDEPTLLVFPDAPFLIPDTYNDLAVDAINQCAKLGDRFAIIDVVNKGKNAREAAALFRTIGTTEANAKYGAAYYPNLKTTIPYIIDEANIEVSIDGVVLKAEASGTKADAGAADDTGTGGTKTKKTTPAETKKGLALLDSAVRNKAKQELQKIGVELTPAAAIAGVYASVDNSRGVWKAPANVSLNYVKAPMINITDDEQDDLNIDVTDGKSINAVRSFIGKGTKVWGARTLSGNDNEWKYINVRRFFNMVEESIKKSTAWAVFEPNDINTWTKVRAMIENYLIMKWKDGALAGAKPNDAFYVRVGLGTTMSAVDVLEGRMIIEIGLAAVRPAEFIVVKFSHKLQVS